METLSYESQTIVTNGTVIVIDEFLKFQNIKKPIETRLAFRTGYWNVFRHTEELQRFLVQEKIVHHVLNRSELE